MAMTRRMLLGLFAALGLAPRTPFAAVVIREEGAPTDPLAALPAYLDTLLPADEESPAASALGVAERIAGKARAVPPYLDLLRAGCAWLDDTARVSGASDFARAAATLREAIVARAEGLPERSLPRVFFLRTREDAFRFYYSRPESWSPLGFDGPPQPRGFPDHARPPRG